MDIKKYLFPIGGAILTFCVILLLTFPMLSMKIKDIPIGIISVDEGMTTPAGNMNAGEQIITKLTEADNSVVNWTVANSKEELSSDLSDGKYYATFLIPETFTKDSATQNSKIQVTINQGLNPLVTMNLTQMLTAMGEQTGMNLEIGAINAIPSDWGMLGMLMPMMIVLMAIVVSIVTSLLITSNIKFEDNKKIVPYILQLAYMIVMAVIIGFTVIGTVVGITDVDLEVAKIALFLTTVSLSLMLLTNGAVNLLGKKGLIIPMLVFALGMGMIQIPFEFMPSAYQVLVASWEPIRYVGIGIRQVLYQGMGVWNSASIALVVMTCIGVLLSIGAMFKKENKEV